MGKLVKYITGAGYGLASGFSLTLTSSCTSTLIRFQRSGHKATTASNRARLTNRSAKSRSVHATQLPPTRVQPPKSRVQPIDGTEHITGKVLFDSSPIIGA